MSILCGLLCCLPCAKKEIHLSIVCDAAKVSWGSNENSRNFSFSLPPHPAINAGVFTDCIFWCVISDAAVDQSSNGQKETKPTNQLNKQTKPITTTKNPSKSKASKQANDNNKPGQNTNIHRIFLLCFLMPNQHAVQVWNLPCRLCPHMSLCPLRSKHTSLVVALKRRS